MNNLIYFIPLVIIIITFVIIYWNKKRKQQQLIDENIAIKVYSDSQERTTKGVLICSKNGISQEFKDIVDESLTEVFNDAILFGQSKQVNWNQKLNHSDYIVYVLDDCTPSPEQHVPCFKLRADEYDGTIFDQDSREGIGYILASEYVIKDGNVPSGEYVICNDIINLYNNARYGAEHIILYFNDIDEYNATVFHGNGVYHPIIPISNI